MMCKYCGSPLEQTGPAKYQVPAHAVGNNSPIVKCTVRSYHRDYHWPRQS